MSKVVDIQKQGRWYKAIVPDDAPESKWQYGIVVGPPALEQLGLPPEIETRLHNELYVRGLIVLDDVLRRLPDVEAALRAALKVDAQAIQACYVGGSTSG